MSQSTPLVQVGEVFAGKYRVERILGEGAMGMVVAAMHLDLHERRAVKFMLPTLLDHTEGEERFFREARACAKLKSKHVAAVYDVGRLENGAPYIVMEYLEGTDLKNLLKERKVLPVHEAVGYLLQACEAVGEAHQAHIVHRDLKPANMYLTTGVNGAPCVKVLDFGIAKLGPSAGLEQQDMTATAAVMGSPLYMSPEQIRSSRNVDARSDIWSLGVILYRMVSGSMPFQATSTPDLFAMILKDPPPPPSTYNPNLPPALEPIILRCFEKEPAMRWQSVAELVAALRPFADAQAAKDIDATTHLWRGSLGSIPDGGALPASTPGHSGAAAAAQGGANIAAQARTAMPSLPSLNAVMPPPSSPGFPQAVLPSSFAWQGGNPPPPASPPGMAPMPLGGPNPLSASGSHPAVPPGVVHQVMETGMASQTGGVWATTSGMTPQPRASSSKGLAIGVAVGGLAFLVGAVVLVLMLKGNAAPDATSVAAPGPVSTNAAPALSPPTVQPVGTVPADVRPAEPPAEQTPKTEKPTAAGPSPKPSTTQQGQPAPAKTTPSVATPTTKTPAADDNPFGRTRK